MVQENLYTKQNDHIENETGGQALGREEIVRDLNECLGIIRGYGDLLRESTSELPPQIVGQALDAIARYADRAKAQASLLAHP
jgi:hypothetical protein